MPVTQAPPSARKLTRVDGMLKVRGEAKYTDDISLPNMLYGAVLRSPYPHARIVSIHVDEALALPGVVAVLTAQDIPYGRFGRSIWDIPVLAKDKVLFVGDRVAAVAAISEEVAQEALTLIDVEYEPLPAVFDAREALQADAPVLHDAPWLYRGSVTHEGDHPNLQSRVVLANGGEVSEALAQSKYVFTDTFCTGTRHQGYLEPHACIARVDEDEVEIWAPNKAPYRLRQQLAEWMGVEQTQVHIHPVFIGGDFGGKGSPMEIPLTISLAQATGRPVKLRMSYAEDLMAADPRHSSSVTVRLGLNEEGRFTALEVDAVLNGGAYAGFKPMADVNLIGIPDAGSAYRIPSIRIQSTIAYTNTVPRGHARAPGSVQMHFPVESLIDMAARELGIDPLVIRERNMLQDGDKSPLGDPYLEVRSRETLEAAKALLSQADTPPLPEEGDWARGVGYTFYQRPTHGGVTEIGLEPTRSGELIVHVPFPDQGGGQLTLGRNILSRLLSMPPHLITVRQAETSELKWDTGCGGSRVTVTASEALHQAGKQLLSVLHERFHLPNGYTLPDLQRALSDFAAAWEGNWLRVSHNANDIEHVCSYNVTIAVVRVDRGTGQIVVEDIYAAYDVANIINPTSHYLQLEGGVIFGFGEAVLEDLMIEDGRVTHASLGEYKLPSMEDIPRVHMALVEGGRGIGEENVKAAGELSNVAVPAAIANAIADAVGVRMKALPITAEQVYFALRAKEDAR
ncbi:xanthine dehydrogenase family protein molybdopterin-binding subunit [Alicyclobacillus cycloheptanicus]|uniref:CO/xanthine dehydrogenase Mo-binding subunit n=1 Tax=Alicyclobacillus cycloheptanicus TaxID=1457 RepID=A0ABT9XI31_9BACL|nr:xanthine dehydrogenase family protein molybdopterin-binding subunit [Alicyclobacillus cycloheptanicus]MDQ0189857.1 CO/xanthine dehydrogenase Mo-binding subunit [Alicyclobacillus cycloheptanicus]WDM02459.1 xanthine dehydrogenase family protein molybdopterin-binding subunit [Alicyclobacillus cycloheptanicus]